MCHQIVSAMHHQSRACADSNGQPPVLNEWATMGLRPSGQRLPVLNRTDQRHGATTPTPTAGASYLAGPIRSSAYTFPGTTKLQQQQQQSSDHLPRLSPICLGYDWGDRGWQQ
jgi:hypothetical protein